MSRLIIFDNLRGIAFLFMIIHHIFYFYDVTNATDYANNQFVSMSGKLARYLFILLAGISLSLTKNDSPIKKRIKRSIEIGIHALIITAITYIYYPDQFIRFGVLHFISIATLLCSFIVPYPKLTILIVILTLFYKPSKLNPFIDLITGASANYKMMDWFPLFPWISLMLTGIIIGQNMDMKLINNIKISLLQNNNILTTLGQNALKLYTIHVILLIIIYKNNLI
jgi:uncharacterized membrane protein